MVLYYLKPLGPEYYQLGIQDRIQYPPTIKIYASLIIYLFLYPFSHLAGSLISHSRRSDLPGPSRSRKDGLLFFPLPGQKTKRVKPDDNKLKGLEQVHHLQTFPHGIGKICDPNHLHRLLHVHNRSARRLLSRPNSPIISKILKIFCPLSRGFCPTLSVSGSPLWDFISSKSVYKDHGGGGCFSETSRSIYHSLFRRPADCGKRQSRSHYSKRSYDTQAFRVGMVNKHPKIRSFSLHPQEIPWGNVRFHSSDVFSSSGESGRSETTRSLLQNEDFYINPRSHEDLGTPYSLSPISGLESKPFSHPTELDSEQLGSKTLRFGQEGHHPILSKKKFTVVVTEEEPGERGPLALSSTSHNCDRCKQCGLGSGLPFPLRPRSMDAFPIPEAIKLSRATGHLGSPKAKYTSPEKQPCTHFIRQHHSGVLLKKTGGDKIDNSFHLNTYDLLLGRGERALPLRNSPERSSKQGGRLPQQGTNFSQRMEHQSRGLHPFDKSVGNSSNRSLRHKEEYGMPSILHSGGRSTEGSTGCFQPPMGRTSFLCLSPYSLSGKGPQKNPYGPGKGDTDLSKLAKEELVSSVDIPDPAATSDTTLTERPVTPGTDSTSRPWTASANSLDPESEFLTSRGLSMAVVTTLKILDFLQKGLEQGLSTSTLKVQVSALGAFCDRPLAEHRWVKRFILASSRIRPQILRRVPTWDLKLVLDALSRPPFEPLDSANIKNLTLKTTLLVAVTTARRLGEIQAISIKEPYMRVLSDRIILTLDPGFIPKVTSRFHRAQEITLPSFCENPSTSREASWHLLDVRRIVLAYIKATESWRLDNNLFIQFQGKNKGRKASKTSIARWLKLAISTCYTQQGKETPTDLKAHSTRAMSTSWAEKRGASLEQICKAATWASSSTFIKHYRLDLPCSQDLSFGRKVLQAVIPP
ncbi:uncharacterized protein [Engystomops pustulosus]|uniref:uncharacterized protein isoform X2 n=1 Tax=Engystomops pustulosus TaxID=76066 RepID=UPI003AFAA5EE